MLLAILRVIFYALGLLISGAFVTVVFLAILLALEIIKD